MIFKRFINTVEASIVNLISESGNLFVIDFVEITGTCLFVGVMFVR